MQINLKQNEIVDALKQYINQQGINLAGKQVEVSFTAGRKEGGLCAEINIEDHDIPGFSGEQATLALVQTPTDPAPAPESVVEAAASAAEAVSAEAPKTTSLFG